MPNESCPICEKAQGSYDEKPFLPPRGTVHDGTFVCTCGQRWWQYNDHFHLWSKIDSKDDETWRNVQGGCREGPVAIGGTSVNLYREERPSLLEVDKPGWPSMRGLKPMNPANYNGINYGYVVKVKKGDNEGVIGLVVMMSRMEDVGISSGLPDKPMPLRGYDIREFPENLEILVREPVTREEFERLQLAK